MTRISTEAQRRQDEARHASGRFGAQHHSAPEATLGAPAERPVTADSLLAARRAQIADWGFTPAVPQMKLTDAANPDQWWARTSSIAEVGQYETMPQRSASGVRSRLKTYEGRETALRMPSVTSVRRFAAEHGTTFDLPVEATTPHGPVTGHVRVTSHGGGRYSVSAVNMPKEHAEYVAESVHATLEARRPSRGLAEVQGILARRRARIASQGASLKPVESSFIRGMGYNPHDGQLIMNIGGRMYGYHLQEQEHDITGEILSPDQVYDHLVHSTSLGRAYNAMVKKRSPRFEVEQHAACGNWHYAGEPHSCPSFHEAPNRAREQSPATAHRT